LISSPSAPLARLVWRAAGPPALRTALLALGLLTLAGLGQALLATSATPPPALLLRLTLAAAGSVASLALGVAALAGAASAAARLAEDRALIGLSTLGVRGSALAPLFVVFALPFAAGQLALHHAGEPLARAALRDARAETVASVRPRDHEAVRLGAWWVARAGDGLAFTDGAMTGVARSASLEPRAGGVLATLGDVELRFADGTAAHTDRAELPVPVAGRGKPHPSERTTPDLQRQIATSATLGRDTYERWLLWKRTLLPAALLALTAAAGGLARRWPAGPVTGALLAGAWVLARLLDTAVLTVGVPLASVLFVAPMLALSVGSWRR
jgi:lipopolysaccharide export LptBFGC system permease protein LptF